MINRIDYSIWCERCEFYEFTLKTGIMCGKTSNKPAFEGTCDLFNLDKKREQNFKYQEQKKQRSEDRAHKAVEPIYSTLLRVGTFAIIALITMIGRLFGVDIPLDQTGVIIFFSAFVYLVFTVKYIKVSERGFLLKGQEIEQYYEPGFCLTNPFRRKYVKVNLDKYLPGWGKCSALEIQQESKAILEKVSFRHPR